MPMRFFHKPDELMRFLQRGDWKVPAVLAAVLLLTVHGVFPLLTPGHTVLTVIGIAATPFVWLVAVLLAGLAVVRFAHERAGVPGAAVPPLEDAATASAKRARPEIGTGARSSRFASCAAAPSQRPREWSLDVLARIEWKRFEDLCCAFYREKGIRARTTPLGPDGGIDIHLFQDPAEPDRATAIVQCKALSGRVGAGPVRELREVMAREQLDKAFFMAPSGFSAEAHAFAGEHRIVLLDGRLFLAMLQRLPADSATRLLEFATDGDWTVPTCPNCGVKLVVRQGEQGEFWRCPLYPNCRCEIPIASTETAVA